MGSRPLRHTCANQVFLVTKLPWYGLNVARWTARILEELGLDYVDLVLWRFWIEQESVRIVGACRIYEVLSSTDIARMSSSAWKNP